MEKDEQLKQLEKFRDYVIKQARSNLTRLGKNSSKKLYDSISSEIKVMPNSIRFYFDMEEYGFYQDKGVKGKDPSKVSKNARIKGQQAPNSPFKFGSGTHMGTWASFVNKIDIWARKKNIRLRDEKGKFKKGNYKTISQIIAKNIYMRGIRPSLFFTKPFEQAFKNLPDELIQAYGLEAEEQFDTIMKENLKEKYKA